MYCKQHPVSFSNTHHLILTYNRVNSYDCLFNVALDRMHLSVDDFDLERDVDGVPHADPPPPVRQVQRRAACRTGMDITRTKCAFFFSCRIAFHRI